MTGTVRILRFGVFEMDLPAGELRRRRYRVPLPPQPFAVLAELARRRGDLVTREELYALLWGADVHVNRERGLNYCLNRIRRALGDDARAPRFVETVARRGYRFLADVEVVAAAPAPEAPAPPAPRARRRRAFTWLAAAATLALALQSADAMRGPRAQGGASPVPAAQAAFSEGRRLLHEGPAGWRRSVELFREAARQDAGFAPAHVSLADAYMRLGENGVLPVQEAFPAARRAVLAALALEDGAEPLVIRAALDLNYDWDWPAAEEAYRRALRLDPDFIAARLGYARLLSGAGRHDEAVRQVRELEARHPGCPFIVRDAGIVHYRARRFDEAARRFQGWAELEPALRDPHHWLALLHYLRGQEQAAVGEVRQVMALAQAHPAFVARFEALPPGPALRFYLRGCVRYMEGLTTEWVTPDELARLRALLGEREQALSDLERAAAQRAPGLVQHFEDPVFDAVRDDARFRALHRRVAPVS